MKPKSPVSSSKLNFSSTAPPPRPESLRTTSNWSAHVTTLSDSRSPSAVTMVQSKLSLATVLSTSTTNFQSKVAQDTMLELIFKKLWLLLLLWLSNSPLPTFPSVVPKVVSRLIPRNTHSVKLKRSQEDTLWSSPKRALLDLKSIVLVQILAQMNRLWPGSKILM